MKPLLTTFPGLVLVAPDPVRDAPFAVKWLDGEAGRTTLRQMGNPESKITPTNLEKETQRLNEFLELAKQGKQLTWMMRLGEVTVGTIWVEFEDSAHLPAPIVSIMIGDASARRRGVGYAAISSVLDYLQAGTPHTKAYARHLVTNKHSAALLGKIGFKKLGDAYEDEDSLVFQNVYLDLDARFAAR